MILQAFSTLFHYNTQIFEFCGTGVIIIVINYLLECPPPPPLESIKEKDSLQSFRPSLKTHFFTQG